MTNLLKLDGWQSTMETIKNLDFVCDKEDWEFKSCIHIKGDRGRRRLNGPGWWSSLFQQNSMDDAGWRGCAIAAVWNKGCLALDFYGTAIGRLVISGGDPWTRGVYTLDGNSTVPTADSMVGASSGGGANMVGGSLQLNLIRYKQQ